MKKLFKEFDEDDKYWTTSSEWRDWYNRNKPIEKEVKPVKLDELVYIKLIQSNKYGMPIDTLYVRRDSNNVHDKQYADLFTLKLAQEFLEKHPKSISQDGQFTFRYEIESLRPY